MQFIFIFTADGKSYLAIFVSAGTTTGQRTIRFVVYFLVIDYIVAIFLTFSFFSNCFYCLKRLNWKEQSIWAPQCFNELVLLNQSSQLKVYFPIPCLKAFVRKWYLRSLLTSAIEYLQILSHLKVTSLPSCFNSPWQWAS